MNYYPFHLGDYAAHTAHLEPMEDLAYRRMLDLYYRTEKPLPDDVEQIGRLIRLREHLAFIRDVLNEFFERTDEGWRHARCDAEIEKMQDKQAKARASAKASVNARSTNAQRTLNERSTDVELPTPTPTPTPVKTKAPRERVAPCPCPEDVGEQVWSDWLQLRKAKRAPVNATVIDGARAEAAKAGMPLAAFLAVWCRRGSQGLEAEWLKPQERAGPSAETSFTRDRKAAANAWMGTAAPKRATEIIDMGSTDARIAIR